MHGKFNPMSKNRSWYLKSNFSHESGISEEETSNSDLHTELTLRFELSTRSEGERKGGRQRTREGEDEESYSAFYAHSN